MKSGMLAAESVYPVLTQFGPDGSIAAMGEEFWNSPLAINNIGIEVKEYDSGE